VQPPSTPLLAAPSAIAPSPPTTPAASVQASILDPGSATAVLSSP
jgi:hypothetical protein